ncbi:hypothetical protein D9758_010693 [Tetrapyrgos nigripes]|uniref:DUF6987 domain-containing protein n=1 Tax=Tetrapyrgos nigripes TaxID=182062 RepID=A0A8H5GGL7_9AGAR|nr:hypothetical protein D9758_010693 [Tetrapyrgos nigripes]
MSSGILGLASRKDRLKSRDGGVSTWSNQQAQPYGSCTGGPAYMPSNGLLDVFFPSSLATITGPTGKTTGARRRLADARMSSSSVDFQQLRDQAKPPASDAGTDTTSDDRTDDQKKADAELANRMSSLIEDANEKVVPLCKMIRKHIENMEARKEEDRNEQELVDAVKPLLIQAEKILNETSGAIKGADPDNRLTNRAKRHTQAHNATPEEQRLAQAVKVLFEEVGGTIEWARDKLDNFPKAKRDLGPLLDALGQPLTQIVGGVMMLLAGVLNLVGNLLSGLGLDSLLKGILSATGLDKIYSGLGLGKWLNSGKK